MVDTRWLAAEAKTLFPKLRITWQALAPTWEGASRRSFEADYIVLFEREAERFVTSADRFAVLSAQIDELLR